MILSHPTFENMLKLTDDSVAILTVENPRQLSSYISELLGQIDGDSGGFSLFDGNEEIPLSEIRLLIDPFNLDLCAKDIQNGIQAKVRSLLNSEEYYVATQEMLSGISKFFNRALGDIDCELVGAEIDATSLVKLMSPHYENEGDSLLENICQYLRVASAFTKARAFIFVNLRTFMNESQMEQLFKFALYEKAHLMLLESVSGKHSEFAHETIIDKDLCEIDIN